jgi:phosphoglycerate dehydrogenase-like enzyme
VRARLEPLVRLEHIEDASLLLDPPSRLAETQILLLGWGAPELDAEVLARYPRLRLVGFAGGSCLGVVDGAAADAAGILRTNAGEANAIPVAEYTLATILLAGTGAFASAVAYRTEQGRIDREARMTHLGTYRMQVGIIGASRIGRRVIDLLRHHDVEVLLYDPTLTESEARELGCTLLNLDDLVSRADVVSVHAPSLPATSGMIGRHELSLMRAGTTLVNTARGALVDQDALVEELRRGRIQAVLDVTSPDPLPAGHPLFFLENAFLTPHVAGSLGRDIGRMGELLASEVGRFLDGRELEWQEPPVAPSTI